jgi:hypothetical protein
MEVRSLVTAAWVWVQAGPAPQASSGQAAAAMQVRSHTGAVYMLASFIMEPGVVQDSCGTRYQEATGVVQEASSGKLVAING